ncbi:MAG: vitamin K epoxide reductase family protein [Planctomycetota bacterium]
MTDFAAQPTVWSRLPLWGVRVLAPVAAGVALFLLTQSSSGGVAGCDGLSGFDCGAALQSRWSVWLGIPVSVAGILCYVGLAVASWMVGRQSSTIDAAGWRILELLTPIALGAAVWFIALQATGMAPLCPYCLAVHTCGIIIAALVLTARLQANRNDDARPQAPVSPLAASQPRSGPLPPPSLGLPTLTGIVAVAALVVVQLMFPPTMDVIDAASLEGDFQLTVDLPPADEEPWAEATASTEGDGQTERDGQTEPNGQIETSEPSEDTQEVAEATVAEQRTPLRRRVNGSRKVELLGGRLTIDAYQYPILGSPEAEHVIVELMNYSCSHCRKFHPTLEEALERYGDQIAVVVLPIPNELLCNKYIKQAIPSGRGSCKLARLAVAVADVAPEQFEPVHAFLLEGKTMPSFTRATIFAKERVNSEKLSDALLADASEEQVKRFIELFAKLSAASRMQLPSQIVGDNILSGAPTSLESLCEAWEERLGVQPITTATSQ